MLGLSFYSMWPKAKIIRNIRKGLMVKNTSKTNLFGVALQNKFYAKDDVIVTICQIKLSWIVKLFISIKFWKQKILNRIGLCSHITLFSNHNFQNVSWSCCPQKITFSCFLFSQMNSHLSPFLSWYWWQK